MTGRVNINLGDKNVRLWFNRFAIFEFYSLYNIKGEEQKNSELIEIIDTESKHNQMILISNLIWIGVFGMAEANLEDYQMTKKEIRLAVADADLSELAKVTEAFFGSMGKDIETDDKKKQRTMEKK